MWGSQELPDWNFKVDQRMHFVNETFLSNDHHKSSCCGMHWQAGKGSWEGTPINPFQRGHGHSSCSKKAWHAFWSLDWRSWRWNPFQCDWSGERWMAKRSNPVLANTPPLNDLFLMDCYICFGSHSQGLFFVRSICFLPPHNHAFTPSSSSTGNAVLSQSQTTTLVITSTRCIIITANRNNRWFSEVGKLFRGSNLEAILSAQFRRRA